MGRQRDPARDRDDLRRLLGAVPTAGRPRRRALGDGGRRPGLPRPGMLDRGVVFVAVELDCSICKKSHTTHVRGEVPEDGKVPCYTCWAQYYLPVLEEDDAYETPSDEDTEKFPIPRPVASNSYDNFPDFQDWDDLSEEEAYYYFGFGL